MDHHTRNPWDDDTGEWPVSDYDDLPPYPTEPAYADEYQDAVSDFQPPSLFWPVVAMIAVAGCVWLAQQWLEAK